MEHFSLSNATVRRALDYMKSHIDEEISLDDVATHLRCCKYNLIRQFKKQMNCTPMRWLWQYRLTRVHGMLLLHPDWSIHQAAQELGFTSLGHLTTLFKREYGITPAAFRDHYRVLQA